VFEVGLVGRAVGARLYRDFAVKAGFEYSRAGCRDPHPRDGWTMLHKLCQDIRDARERPDLLLEALRARPPPPPMDPQCSQPHICWPDLAR
jgi:hypothetical protein